MLDRVLGGGVGKVLEVEGLSIDLSGLVTGDVGLVGVGVRDKEVGL